MKIKPMAYPMVLICRKSDEYSARYDQKGVAAVKFSSHHGGAAGDYFGSALHHSGSVRDRMGTRSMSLIQH